MSAVLSECGNYRYCLTRWVNPKSTSKIAYIGVNPSTADALTDDATVRRWIGFSKRFGAKRFRVGNLFAYRATDVSRLASAEDPVGPYNDVWLGKIISEADLLVPCWGRRTKLPKSLHYRIDEVLTLLRASGKPVMTFGLTKSGDPKHPLMLPYATKLIPLEQ